MNFRLSISTRLLVTAIIFAVGSVKAQDSTQRFAIQLSTGTYPLIKRIVYETLPPQLGPALPYFKYTGCIATPGVSYRWGKNIMALGIRTYLPQPKLIRTGAELSYEWVHQRPAKKVDHTFGGELVYNYYRNNGSFLQYGPPYYYTKVESDFILTGTAGLRKIYPSRLYLFSTSGAGLLIPASSLKVSDPTRRFFESGPHSMQVEKLQAIIMLKLGIGYSL